MNIDIRHPSQTSPSETGTETEPVIVPEGGEPIEPTPPSPVEPAPSTVEPPTPPAPVSPAPVVPPAPVDYKKKFSESTRETQVLLGSFADMKRVLGEVTNADIPTDEELRRDYPEYDALSDFEQNQLRRSVIQDRKLNKVLVIVDGVSTEAEKVKTISEFIDTRSELEGKEQEFLRFCLMPSHKGAPAETLLSAFLFDSGKTSAPVEPAAPAPVTPPATRGLERGTPGGDATPSIGPRKHTDEELKDLRTRDPKKYHEMIRKGQI